MARSIKNRLSLFQKQIINNNQELDYLSETVIDFAAFPTQEFIFLVRQEHVGRIDLISYQAYGTANLWWLVAQRNQIIDPLSELSMGQEILIPALTDYYNFFNLEVKVEEETDLIFDKRVLD